MARFLWTAVFAALCLGVGGRVSAQENAIKIGMIAPDGSSAADALRKAGKEIESATQGRVVLKFYTGGVMGTGPTLIRKLKAGQLQGAVLTPNEAAQLYKDFPLLSLPMLLRTPQMVDKARAKLEPKLLKGLKDSGWWSPGLVEVGFVHLLSKKPIKSIDDFKNLKPWTQEGDTAGNDLIVKLGASPTTLPLSDVLTGLSTGMIDAVGNSPAGALALQWFTAVNHIADTPLFYTYGAVVIGEKALAELQKPDRTLLEETLGKVSAELDRKNRAEGAAAYETLVREGVKPTTPDPKTLEILAATAREVVEERKKAGKIDAGLLAELYAIIK